MYDNKSASAIMAIGSVRKTELREMEPHEMESHETEPNETFLLVCEVELQVDQMC